MNNGLYKRTVAFFKKKKTINVWNIALMKVKMSAKIILHGV